MPVITIQALPVEMDMVEKLLGEVVTDLAAAINTPPANVWANFTPMMDVQEGGPDDDQTGYHPIVTVLAKPRDPKLVTAGLEAVAKAVARGLGVPIERVWINWRALEPGQLFSGGKVE
jgi:hypothetical protein